MNKKKKKKRYSDRESYIAFIYSSFEKGCRKKCPRQSPRVLCGFEFIVDCLHSAFSLNVRLVLNLIQRDCKP